MVDDPKFPRQMVEERMDDYVDIRVLEYSSTSLESLANEINQLFKKYPNGSIIQYEHYGSATQRVIVPRLENDEEYQCRLDQRDKYAEQQKELYLRLKKEFEPGE